MEKRLGKIAKVTFGKGGYQDAQFGLSLCFDFDGSRCQTQIGSAWDAATIDCSSHCKWSEEDRAKGHDEMCRKVSQLLKDAKVDSVDQLLGKPIEAEFDQGGCGQLKDWRILKEVL
jgi:hypothetical protein